jgi:hypothetical protein
VDLHLGVVENNDSADQTLCNISKRSAYASAIFTVKDCRTAFWKARSIKTDPWQLQAQLGHKSLGTTDRYATYDPSYLSEVCAAIQSFYEAVAGQLLASEQTRSLVSPIEVPANIV